jgi:cytochrome c biogenesis protein CcmG/thiol:disulfide interchange protein DsbE
MKYLLMMVIAFLFFSASLAQETEQNYDTAPNFTLEDINGDVFELEENFGDGPILISFWATWCKPCKEELPHLQDLLDKYKEKGLKVLAISTDSEKSIAKVKPFIKSQNYSFEVLYDTNSEVANMYAARVVPFTVIVNKNGEIVYQNTGYSKGDELEAEKIITSLL